MQKLPAPKIRLSVYGCLKAVGDKVSGVVEKFDWNSALADSALLAAITFFATLGGGTVADIPSLQMLTVSAVAAGSQFVTVLALKRGLIKKEGCA